jgi:hypothetical protein
MAVTINASTTTGLVQSADTSGNIELQSNGTTKATVSSSGLAIGQYNPSASLVTSGTAVNTTSGTSIDFTSIPSWVKRVTVMLSGVSTNGSSNWLIQLGDSGGIENTGYISVSTYLGSSTGGTSYTTGFGLIVSSSTHVQQGLLTLCNLTGNVWTANGSFAGSGTAADFLYSTAGSKTLSATLDRVRITTVNGTDTFDAGSINILYE